MHRKLNGFDCLEPIGRSWTKSTVNTITRGGKERDSKKRFIYYEADVEFISPSEMIISFYEMASTVYGGRGEIICTIPGVPDVAVVKQVIEQRILELTTKEYDRREVERLKKQREEGITTLRQELFGKLKY